MPLEWLGLWAGTIALLVAAAGVLLGLLTCALCRRHDLLLGLGGVVLLVSLTFLDPFGVLCLGPGVALVVGGLVRWGLARWRSRFALVGDPPEGAADHPEGSEPEHLVVLFGTPMVLGDDPPEIDREQSE